MKQIDEIHFTADEGKTFRRKSDSFIIGNNIYLGIYIDGTDDVIDNYDEVADENISQSNNGREE